MTSSRSQSHGDRSYAGHTKSLPYVVHGRRAIYPNSPVSYQKPGERKLRTANDKLQVAHQTVYDLKCLGSSHASLIEGEAVDSTEDVLDLALSKQFLRQLFWGEVTNKADIIT